MRADHGCRRAFSLIELVIVVAIIGVVAAIAIPRLSRGAAGASEKTLQGDLSVLRSAIDFYIVEHGGVFPEQDSTFVAQLTQYTDFVGNTNPVPTPTHVFGPYLARMPPLPVGENKGSTGVRDGGNPKDDELDASGVPYNTY